MYQFLITAYVFTLFTCWYVDYVSSLLSGSAITSLHQETPGSFACLVVCKQFVVSRLSALALGSRGRVKYLIVALPGDGFIALF